MNQLLTGSGDTTDAPSFSFDRLQGQRFCLLLRGIAFRQGYKTRGSTRKTVTVDYRTCLQSTRDNVIKPLEAVGKLEVILASYTSALDREILADFAPVDHRFFRLLPISGKALQLYKALCYLGLRIPGQPILQGELLLEGLRLVADRADLYDFVVISRFDLEYLLPVNRWPISPDKINLLWKETESGWNGHRRVGDCIHVIPIKFLSGFFEAIKHTRRKSCLHFIFPEVVKACGESSTHFLCDGYLDSNSDRFPNPIYRIVRS